METRGDLWRFMDIYGDLWRFMGIHSEINGRGGDQSSFFYAIIHSFVHFIGRISFQLVSRGGGGRDSLRRRRDCTA